ncbi:RluA family pseudouridine synthase [Staphylococcus sp. SQ8-PEA]|uniref:RNA pseudouridylate synthase n=1 Tax=Staphylococcus marylandisciuri TaxID=2981529 RepID=A0ABT2QPU0_9STAP|nr:RluA family pseudouridine synthase [Staphylococcus marylandisciuri]MCU5745998.1 RluA family pseudouridine synthase [Staphylococcus marylandisciuri]
MHFSYLVEEETLLRHFLQRQLYSKKTLSAIKRNGALLVNGQKVTVRYQLSIGDKLEVYLPKETYSSYLIPHVQPLNILYEDDYFIIVSKPNNQNCAPSREHPHASLIEQVIGYLQQRGSQVVPHIVTRLDRHTLGIVIFAKHGFIHHLMSYAQMQKWYYVICYGHIFNDFTISAPIARADNSIIRREVRTDGKPAVTKLELINRSQAYSLCRAQLITGRTHQLRVHFAYIGHPIVGDDLYEGKHHNYKSQLLRCVEVQFIHPITKKEIVIKDKYQSIETIFNMV